MTISSEPSRPRPLLVAGLGNPDRGDDGFGPAVIAHLARLALPEVDLLAFRRPLDLLDHWEGRGLVLVLDAALPQGKPGRLHRIDPLWDWELLPPAASASTHGLGLAEAIELGRTLGRLPGQIILYAVEGSSFAPGAPLSPSVAAAVDEAVERIAEERRRAG
ncbi:hydrogenase maturation protease [Methylacidimicrobium sp. B4]|uniref:hydrogenase maturation protease n=1 Tax=Methylacidimicrobium sp. B4 TaxID=2796139 RepID=UPI001A901446|nr:hydrogenase maturation protease [Methylacidimicrobium sp. B4]QSR85470.1 hydrogenase maturation protease [Methylacidimicrobium sp. B4]